MGLFLDKLVFVGGMGATLNAIATVNAVNSIGQKYQVLGCLDDNPSQSQIRTVGSLSAARSFDYQKLVVATFASVGNQGRVLEYVNRLEHGDEIYPVLIDPNSNVAFNVHIGVGTVVCAGASISPNVKVGKHCMVFPNASLGSGTVLGDGVAVANSASFVGPNSIGDSSFIGANSTIGPKVSLGANCVVGMGAVVLSSFPAGSVIVGNPGRPLRSLDNV